MTYKTAFLVLVCWASLSRYECIYAKNVIVAYRPVVVVSIRAISLSQKDFYLEQGHRHIKLKGHGMLMVSKDIFYLLFYFLHNLHLHVIMSFASFSSMFLFFIIWTVLDFMFLQFSSVILSSMLCYPSGHRKCFFVYYSPILLLLLVLLILLLLLVSSIYISFYFLFDTSQKP